MIISCFLERPAIYKFVVKRSIVFIPSLCKCWSREGENPGSLDPTESFSKQRPGGGSEEWPEKGKKGGEEKESESKYSYQLLGLLKHFFIF